MNEIDELLLEAESKGLMFSFEKHKTGSLHTIILWKKVPYKIFFLKNASRWIEVFYKIYNLPLEKELAVKDLKKAITS